MNIRNVLKTYSLLRTLSDDETALLNTLRSMNENERELLVGSLAPTPQKKTAKKATKKANKGASKSAHASSLQAQIQGRVAKGKADESDDDNRFDGASAQAARGEFLQSSGCGKCGQPEDYPIHDPNGGYVTHHPFVSPSSAPRAAGRSSSANGSRTELAASSEAGTADVSVAAGD